MKKKPIKICIVVGTRPEIIKLAPVIKYCVKNKLNFFIINTSQHYDYIMSKIFFDELGLPHPKYHLDASKGTHAEETGEMVVFIERVLTKEKPGVVLVQGDTNTVLSGALAAAKMLIPVAHIEAGLRSFDERMPEELNRILTDHMSSFLFAPAVTDKMNLLKDGIFEKKIFVVGNTIVDAVYNYGRLNRKPLCIGDCYGLDFKKDSYMLVTAHRPENVDFKDTLQEILKGIELVYKKFWLPMVYPIHPRTKKMIKQFDLKVPEGLRLIEPVGYLHMLELIKKARLVLTDSGGIQEEACVLKVPCVTMRMSTERPETVSVGANIISGVKPLNILKCAEIMFRKQAKWSNPYGNGKTAEKIMKILLSRLQ